MEKHYGKGVVEEMLKEMFDGKPEEGYKALIGWYKKRGREALFLPQVWEILKDKKLFLSELALKAGLGPNEWRDSELYEFEAEIIKLERPYA